MLRDLVLRYFYVISPEEHFLIQTLVVDIAHLGKVILSPPVDANDARLLANNLHRQLMPPQGNMVPVKLFYVTALTEFTLWATEECQLFHLYAPIFAAAFNRVWREIGCSCQDAAGESWMNILFNANPLIYGLMYVFFLPRKSQ